MKTSLFIIFLFFAIIHCNAQSTAETAEGIQRDLDSIKAEFVTNLRSAMSNPENLQSGQTKIGCEQILSKLDQLIFRIDETIDLIAKRESDLGSNSVLGESEKLELKQVLQSQKKPLEASKQTASSLKSELKALVDQKLDSVLETYSSFRDIAGPEKAREKVEERLNEILAPYLPPKPKPTPTPPPAPKPKPSPSTTPSISTRSNNQNTSITATKPAAAAVATPVRSAQKKNSRPVWRPKDKLPKEIQGHGVAGRFAIQGSTIDSLVILVPAEDADNPFARQFWITNRTFPGGPNVLVPIGQKEIIQIPASNPLIITGRGILPGVYNVVIQ
jgi:hypothetical protein